MGDLVRGANAAMHDLSRGDRVRKALTSAFKALEATNGKHEPDADCWLCEALSSVEDALQWLERR